ncbi:hypothetical protein Salat_0447900 [Sesamum alatum]|uniref:Uncharacterized protein n=1 Tax=Sesamum alatum TaxID=300844 RepID=A0AAE1Z2K8_9LAMI|nr:hypothetical protein Salat_0447900 [Sesamum alatum]
MTRGFGPVPWGRGWGREHGVEASTQPIPLPKSPPGGALTSHNPLVEPNRLAPSSEKPNTSYVGSSSTPPTSSDASPSSVAPLPPIAQSPEHPLDGCATMDDTIQGHQPIDEDQEKEAL